MRLDYIGHSTFLITTNDSRVILTDPWFGGGSALMKRHVEPAIRPEAVKRCDVIIASHAHDDHIDGEALLLAKRLGSAIVGPGGVARKAAKAGIGEHQTIILKEGMSSEISGFRVHAIPARHVGEAMGFLVETSEGTLYHSGDTILFAELKRALSEQGIEIALVNTRRPKSPVQEGHDGHS